MRLLPFAVLVSVFSQGALALPRPGADIYFPENAVEVAEHASFAASTVLAAVPVGVPTVLATVEDAEGGIQLKKRKKTTTIAPEGKKLDPKSKKPSKKKSAAGLRNSSQTRVRRPGQNTRSKGVNGTKGLGTAQKPAKKLTGTQADKSIKGSRTGGKKGTKKVTGTKGISGSNDSKPAGKNGSNKKVNGRNRGSKLVPSTAAQGTKGLQTDCVPCKNGKPTKASKGKKPTKLSKGSKGKRGILSCCVSSSAFEDAQTSNVQTSGPAHALYSGAPSIEDVTQGPNRVTCWLTAAAITIVHHQPNLITKMFSFDQPNTPQRASKVTVKLPKYKAVTSTYSPQSVSDVTRGSPWWIAAVESAVEVAMKIGPGELTRNPDMAKGLAMLTGKAPQTFLANNDPKAMWRMIQKAKSRPLVAATPRSPENFQNPQYTFEDQQQVDDEWYEAGHVYAILDVSGTSFSDGKVTIRNPYSIQKPGASAFFPKTRVVPLVEMMAIFETYAWV